MRFKGSTVQSSRRAEDQTNSQEDSMAVRNFEDLNVWKQARQLTEEVYRLTKTEKFLKDFGLRDQIQRAAISVMSNIAEGFERGGNQEFNQFLYVAKSIMRRSKIAALCRTRSGICDSERQRKVIAIIHAVVWHD
jgi:four helix bundle protein